MLSLFKNIWRCLFTPRLYRIYRVGHRPRNAPIEYKANMLERWGDFSIYTMYLIYYYSIYFTPFLSMHIYNHGYLVINQLYNTMGYLGPFLFLSFVSRTLGRALNREYLTFINNLYAPVNDKEQYMKTLRTYDFEFHAWPVNYSVEPKISIFSKLESFQKNPFKSSANDTMPLYKRMPVQLLGYIATHTFAISLIYPGSLAIIQSLFYSRLLEGRALLVEQYNGKRAKLSTADMNDIDTMFVDLRGQSEEGNVLVICSEGNSGFYEVGIMMTPVKAGYSALGWNHPGFCGSTGTPYPRQEHNAMDAVIQYAINELKFDVKNIVLYGWSIGGYASAWGAVHYPDIKCLVLDASFDDIMPLAMVAMPRSWSPIVREVIQNYVNLNISELLSGYDGPVDVVRRTEDEIICVEKGNLISNRGNYLVLKIIGQRHNVFSDPQRMRSILQHMTVVETELREMIAMANNRATRECLLLIFRYMRDFRATHCEPLPEQILDDIIRKYD